MILFFALGGFVAVVKNANAAYVHINDNYHATQLAVEPVRHNPYTILVDPLGQVYTFELRLECEDGLPVPDQMLDNHDDIIKYCGYDQ